MARHLKKQGHQGLLKVAKSSEEVPALIIKTALLLAWLKISSST